MALSATRTNPPEYSRADHEADTGLVARINEAMDDLEALMGEHDPDCESQLAAELKPWRDGLEYFLTEVQP